MSNVVIINIESNYSAEKAGLQVGDLIRLINGNWIQTADQVYQSLAEFKPADEIELEGYPSDIGEPFW